MKVWSYASDGRPRDWGRAHGEAFREMVRELSEIRIALALSIGRFRSREELMSVASVHLPLLEAFDVDLYNELVGIAEGAGVSPEEIVVLNHYTDIRDLDPQVVEGAARHTRPVARPSELPGNEEGCSLVFAHGPEGALLGQTWDMHGSAEPYVMMLAVPEHEDANGNRRPGAWIFTLTGCLGMAGMSADGVAVGINNLRSLDAQVGVVWSAFVRRLLVASDHASAAKAGMAAPIGSGHHYFVADAHGGFGFETSGVLREPVFRGERQVFVHTNHCLNQEVAQQTTVTRTSTTHERYAVLRPLENGPAPTASELWTALGSHEGYPRSVCSHLSSPEEPHASRTCGGLVMDLGNGVIRAAAGCLNHAQPLRFGFQQGKPVSQTGL